MNAEYIDSPRWGFDWILSVFLFTFIEIKKGIIEIKDNREIE